MYDGDDVSLHLVERHAETGELTDLGGINLLGLDTLDVDEAVVAAASKNLATLGIATNAALKKLTLVVTANGDSDSIAIKLGGAAVAGVNPLPPGVYEFSMSKAVADTMQLIRGDDGDVEVTVVQEG